MVGDSPITMSAGRKCDAIWYSFTKITTPDRKGCRAKCIECGIEMEGLVNRLKNHKAKCGVVGASTTTNNNCSHDQVEFADESPGPVTDITFLEKSAAAIPPAKKQKISPTHSHGQPKKSLDVVLCKNNY